MAVVITQVGVVTPFGRGLEAFQEGVDTASNSLSVHESLRWMESSLAGVAPQQFRQYLKRRKAAKLMTPSARLAMDAVGQIWDVVGKNLHPVETGLFFSVGREPPDEGDAEAALIASAVDNMFSEEALATRGRSLYPPLLPLKTLPNLILGHLSIHFGLCGENAAWAGEGVQSFVESVWAITEGRSARILVGAADSLIDLGQARDIKRLGISSAPGEAAVAWLLEDESVATSDVIARVEVEDISTVYSESDTSRCFKSTLRSQIGYCGVVEPQLSLLREVLQGGVVSWNGLRISAKV